MPNDILIKLFAAHSLSESQSEKGTKMENSVLFCFVVVVDFIFPN